MATVIIYKTPEGNTAIYHHSPKSSHTIEQVADRVVPTGLNYDFFDDSIVPTDRTFRAAWDIDSALLTKVSGGENA